MPHCKNVQSVVPALDRATTANVAQRAGTAGREAISAVVRLVSWNTATRVILCKAQLYLRLLEEHPLGPKLGRHS